MTERRRKRRKEEKRKIGEEEEKESRSGERKGISEGKSRAATPAKSTEHNADCSA